MAFTILSLVKSTTSLGRPEPPLRDKRKTIAGGLRRAVSFTEEIKVARYRDVVEHQQAITFLGLENQVQMGLAIPRKL
jgi:hypothetical protein